MVCNKEYHKAYYQKHKEKLKERSSKRYRSNPEKHSQAARKNKLRKQYNLTEQDYETMLEQQGYSCAICETHISNMTKRLYVDHDHSTGVVRGLLCSNCNFGIGLFRDDEMVLDKAIKYLQSRKKQL